MLRALFAASRSRPCRPARRGRPWADTLADARGQTVYWNAWGGDEQINAYIAWVGEQVQRALRRRARPRQAHRYRRGGRARGRREGGRADRGRLGRPDLDQRRELRRDEVAGSAVRAVRRAAAELPLRRHRRQAHDAGRLHDPDRRPGSALGHGAVRVPLRHGEWSPSRRARSRRCWTGPRPIPAASPIRRRPTSSARPSSSRCWSSSTPDPEVLQRPAADADFAAVTAPLWHWLEAIRPYLWRRGATFPATGPALHQLLDDGEVDFSMAFNPAEASAAINAGRLPETVRTFILEGRHDRQHPLRRDPVQRRPQGGRHGGRRLPDVAGGAGAQAGPARLGRRHGARPRQARRRRPGALRGPAARHRDPAAGRAGAGAARAASVLDDRRSRPSGCGASAASEGSRPARSACLARLSAGADAAGVPRAGRGRACSARCCPPSAICRRSAASALSLEPWRQLRRRRGSPSALRLTLDQRRAVDPARRSR